MADEVRGQGKLILIHEYLDALCRRAAVLKGHALEPSRWPSPTAATEAVLQELDTAQEELLVADEELRRQSEELERIRQGIAAELRRFRDVFDHSPDVYVETDAQGVIRMANRTFAAQLNVPQRFLERKPLINFVVRGDSDRFRKMLARLGRGKVLRASSLRLRPRHEGAPFFVDVHATPIVDPSNRVLGLRWAMRTLADADDAPFTAISITALANALVAQASGSALGKGRALRIEVPAERRLNAELSAGWFPILSAMVRAELALGTPGTELRIQAISEGVHTVWHIGSARVSLATAPAAGAARPEAPPSSEP